MKEKRTPRLYPSPYQKALEREAYKNFSSIIQALEAYPSETEETGINGLITHLQRLSALISLATLSPSSELPPSVEVTDPTLFAHLSEVIPLVAIRELIESRVWVSTEHRFPGDDRSTSLKCYSSAGEFSLRFNSSNRRGFYMNHDTLNISSDEKIAGICVATHRNTGDGNITASNIFIPNGSEDTVHVAHDEFRV